MTPLRTAAAAISILTALGCGCGGASSEGAPTGANDPGAPPGCVGGGCAPTLSSITVEPTPLSMAAGVSQQYRALATYSNGDVQDVTALATWSSSDETVALVASGGLASAVSVGTATVTAAYGGSTGTGSLETTPAKLVSLSITPPDPTVCAGLDLQLKATGTFTDGTTQDLTDQSTWTSSDPLKATVSQAGTAHGLATGAATVAAAVGGVAASASLTVTSAVVQSLTIAPSSATIPKGTSQQYVATASYTDGSTQDVTSSADWSTSDAGVAPVSAPGQVTGASLGSAQVSATYGGVPASASLTVSAPALVSLSISPPSPTLSAGLDLQLQATGSFTDGSVQDLTGQAAWSSSNPAAATISPAGLAHGVAGGSSTIEAAVGGVTASTTLAVSGAAVVYVSITPAAATVAKGTFVKFSAAVVYTDGATLDVTSSAAWSSSDGGVAAVSAAGQVTGVELGSAEISAAYGGVTASAPVTVSAATLASLSIDPTTPTVPAGVQQHFTATGIFSDGSHQDLTAQVAWTSSDLSVATVTDAGLAQAISGGSAVIQAAMDGATASTLLTVSSAALQAINVVPSASSIAKGTTVAMNAIGLYSDGSTADLTGQVAWSSSDPAVAAVSPDGIVRGVASGSATVKAALQGISDQASITVTAAVLQALALSPATLSLPLGLTAQLSATGTFSDGSTQDLTTQVGWSSSDVAVASVSNSAGASGRVTALGTGSATLTATGFGCSATAQLTITSALLQSIAVTPPTARTAAGYQVQFQAVGTYSDGATRDLTGTVTWSSSNPLLATVSATGLATGVAPGTATIQGALGGVAGTAALTVTNAKIVSIAVAPPSFTITIGGQQQLVATGTFSDGSTADVTRQCSWTSSVKSIAWVSKTGVVTGAKKGSVVISAKRAGKKATSSGTVQ